MMTSVTKRVTAGNLTFFDSRRLKSNSNVTLVVDCN